MRQFFLIFISICALSTPACAREARIVPISDALMTRMREGGSWKSNTPASLREQLRLVHLHYIDEKGRAQQGEMIVHRSIAQDVVEIFDSLYRANYRIGSIRLIDDFGANDDKSMEANNTSCFNYRHATGSRTGRISAHGMGLAIDINPLWNPYVKGSVVKPRGARRRPAISTQDLAYRLFRAHGFVWGGNWRSVKDYQHFEKPLR